MYCGRVVENADIATIFESPAHPYTKACCARSRAPKAAQTPLSDPRRGALAAGPRPGLRFLRSLPETHGRLPRAKPPLFPVGERQEPPATPLSRGSRHDRALLSVEGLARFFRRAPLEGVRPAEARREGRRRDRLRGRARRDAGACRRIRLRQVDDRPPPATAHRADCRAHPLPRPRHRGGRTREMHELRRHLQIIFQDPYGSLSPRRTVADIVAEPLDAHGLVRDAARTARRGRAIADPRRPLAGLMDRYPREFSGGQRQRIGIARAIGVDPPSSSPTSRSRHSMSRCRRRSSTCSRICRRSRGSPISSSRTTSRRPAHRLSRRGDVSRPHRRGRPEGRDLRRSAASLFAGSAFGRARARPRAARNRRIILQGDVPEPDRRAVRMQLPDALPAGPADLRGERPALRAVAPGQEAACHFAQPNPLGRPS